MIPSRERREVARGVGVGERLSRTESCALARPPAVSRTAKSTAKRAKIAADAGAESHQAAFWFSMALEPKPAVKGFQAHQAGSALAAFTSDSIKNRALPPI